MNRWIKKKQTVKPNDRQGGKNMFCAGVAQRGGDWEVARTFVPGLLDSDSENTIYIKYRNQCTYFVFIQWQKYSIDKFTYDILAKTNI